MRLALLHGEERCKYYKREQRALAKRRSLDPDPESCQQPANKKPKKGRGLEQWLRAPVAKDDEDKDKGYKPQEGKDDDKDGEPQIENDAEAPAPVAKDDDGSSRHEAILQGLHEIREHQEKQKKLLCKEEELQGKWRQLQTKQQKQLLEMEKQLVEQEQGPPKAGQGPEKAEEEPKSQTTVQETTQQKVDLYQEQAELEFARHVAGRFQKQRKLTEMAFIK